MFSCFPIFVFNTTHVGGNGPGSPAFTGIMILNFTRVIIPAMHKTGNPEKVPRARWQSFYVKDFLEGQFWLTGKEGRQTI